MAQRPTGPRDRHPPARQSEREHAREAELAEWLRFDPEPEPIAADETAIAMLARLHIELSDAELSLLSRYLGMLFAANERFNLTRIDRESAWSRHVIDALTLLAPIEGLERATTAIDIGSGGGVPGIPLAIARPDIAWTLLEATGKKARFLEAVVRTLGLANVEVVQSRAEIAARGPLREAFDVATSRAVGALGGLATISVPFLRIGGVMLAIKGARAADELAEAKQRLYELHAAVVGEIRTETNTIVAIEKQRKTPAKFP
ncbi:MAG: 16S rRNA (guanine(527)-N(7))-methyltransferase RsmG [Phycisphaera sp.]|nr:16S rRNA (guanine(527)-N(7))-methyltransferase RsmG [Phycisphaera sp.]